MIKEDFELNGYTLHIIPMKHIKTLTISVKLLAPLSYSNVTSRTLLSYLLISSTKKLNTTLKLSRFLETLYGCNLSSNVSSKGKTHIISINFTFVNNQYIQEDLLTDVIELLKEILLNPNVENNSWNKEIFDLKVNELKQRYISFNDDKVSYSLNQLFNYMGKDTPLGIDTYGSIEQLNTISPESIYNTLNDVLKNDIKHIYVVGDVNESFIEKFKNHLSLHSNVKFLDSAYTFESNKQETLEIIEQQNIVQSKLNIGYTINGNFSTERHYAYTVLSMILGGYSQSKLFLNIREKNSLCYYISSNYDAFNGILYILAGIDQNQYHRVIDLINEQIEEIKLGNITQDELNLAKKLLVSSILKANDEPSRLLNLYFNRDLIDKNESLTELIDHINHVTIEEIVDAAQFIKQDSIYFLTGENNGSYSI